MEPQKGWRTIMAANTIRATVYLDSEVHRALREKAARTRRSISEIVNAAVEAALQEDEEDLAAFDERAGEQPLGYEALLTQLRADGTL
jgi:hypothetical protein